MKVSDNLAEINHNIIQSALKVGRNPQEITLVAVSKFIESERIAEALAAGVTNLAENRVQEGVRKFPDLAEKFSFKRHLIGSLQTNKAKAAIENFDLIHSMDRLELAEALSKQAEKLNAKVEFLIQVNVSGEESKHGCRPEELMQLVQQVQQLPGLVLSGLMTMAPLEQDAEAARPVFRGLKQLFDEVGQSSFCPPTWRYLSMGMSQDYEIAVEEGANLLRVGSKVFA